MDSDDLLLWFLFQRVIDAKFKTFFMILNQQNTFFPDRIIPIYKLKSPKNGKNKTTSMVNAW